MIIRRARREDVPAIVAIYGLDFLRGHREIVSSPLPELYFHAFEAIDADPAHLLLVAEDESQVVGSLQLTFVQYLIAQGLRRAVLEAMFVHPSRRGRGVGTALVQFAIQAAKDARCGTLELTSNKSRDQARRFYAKLGFEPSHEGFKLSL